MLEFITEQGLKEWPDADNGGEEASASAEFIL